MSKVGPEVEQLAQGARIEIALLGGLRVHAGKELLHLPTRKGQALLAYLAIGLDKLHDREKLCALLWPESPKAQAQATLRQTLLTVRKVLAPHSRSVIKSAGTTIALDAAQVWVDLAALERHLAADSLEALAPVAGLCAGPLLDGFISGESSFDDWLAFERMRVQSCAVRALARLADLQAKAGFLDRATETALRSLHMDPLQEQTHRALMRLYALQGRRGDALRQFESCKRILGTDLGASPENETQRLYAEISNGSLSSGAAIPRAAARKEPDRPIVGRQAERDQLRNALTEAWAGKSRLVLLRGDAGVGKSRLLEDVSVRCAEHGGTAVSGRCFESEQVLPFALWADLLRGDAAGWRRAAEKSLPRSARAEIARILPLGGGVEEASTSSRDERVLFEAIVHLCDRMSQESPLLLLLEDLQWADAMSLRLLSYVVRHQAASARVCLMATVRAEEVAGAAFLQPILHEIARDGRLVDMDVLPLSRDHTTELVQSLSPSGSDHRGGLFEVVWALSEGNPLVVLEALRDGDQAAISPAVTKLPVPLRVRAIIAEHVARLDARCQEALAVASVIGRRFEFELLERARGATGNEGLTVIEELVRSRFLTPSGDGFYFTHDRIREAVYESLLPPRRRMLHGSVARALEQVYSDRIDDVCGAIGYHFMRAGEAAASIRYLMRFAERALNNHGVREAFAALGEAEWQTAELPVNERDAIGVAIAIARAHCLLFLGRITEIEPMLAPHRPVLERLDLPVLSASFHQLAVFAHTSLRDKRRADEHETHLLAVASRSDEAKTAGIALSQLGHASMVSGRYRSGIEHALEATAKLDGCDDPQAAAFAWLHLAGNYLGAGECWKALDAASRAIAIGEGGDIPRVQALGLLTICVLRACAMGELDAGFAAAARAIELSPDPYTQWWSHYMHVRIRAFAVIILQASAASTLDASFDASVAAMEATTRTTLENALGPWADTARGALAEAHLARGAPETALSHAVAAVEGLRAGADPFAMSGTLRTAGMAELMRGNLDEAARWFDEARRFAEPITPLETAAAIAGRAMVAVAQRDLPVASALFKEAHRMYESLRLPFWTTTIVRMAADHGLTI